jgi:hypothetical protein
MSGEIATEIRAFLIMGKTGVGMMRVSLSSD